jgi:hypothetical protein
MTRGNNRARNPRRLSNPRYRTFSNTRSCIIFLRKEEGWTWKKILRRTGAKERTAKRWFSEWEATGKIDDIKRGPHGKSKRTPRVISLVKAHMKGKKNRSLRTCGAFLERKSFKLDRRTIRRILREDLRLHPYRKRIRPKLSDVHKRKRVAFAQAQLDTGDDWMDTAFTDEKRFSMEPYPNKKNDIIWDDQPDDDKHYTPRSKYEGQSVEVWGAITPYGKPKLVFIERKYVGGPDGKQYKKKFGKEDFTAKILKKRLPALKRIFEASGTPDWRPQQDGDSKHTSNLVQHYLRDNTPRYTNKNEWPPNSPDLSIIENVWSVMDTELRKKNIRTAAGLKRAIRRIWNDKITQSYIQTLYDSLPRRWQAVLDSNGEATKY